MSNSIRILLCEDDTNLAIMLKEYLEANDFSVDLFPDGEKGLAAFQEKEYDLCILDVMMPLKDGFTLARDIRKTNQRIPIIFLTVKSLKEDIFEGFQIGADDYITKPFSQAELKFRIEAIMRRVNAQKLQNVTEHTFGGYVFDHQKRTLTYGNEEITLTTKESEMLHLFVQNQNQLIPRNDILKAIWGEVTFFNGRSMDVYITKLRKILSKDPDVKILNTHGKGYKLIAPMDKNA